MYCIYTPQGAHVLHPLCDNCVGLIEYEHWMRPTLNRSRRPLEQCNRPQGPSQRKTRKALEQRTWPQESVLCGSRPRAGAAGATNSNTKAGRASSTITTSASTMVVVTRTRETDSARRGDPTFTISRVSTLADSSGSQILGCLGVLTRNKFQSFNLCDLVHLRNLHNLDDR